VEFLRALYFTRRLWLLLGALTTCFVLGHFFSLLFTLAQMGLSIVVALVVLDLFLLYRTRQGIAGRRQVPERLSNGDDNPIRLNLENHYPFPLIVRILDELPPQFQKRDFALDLVLPARATYTTHYTVRPLSRGEYHFGALNVYACSRIGLASRRYRFAQDVMVPVYPSFLQMRRYELFALSDRLAEAGLKKVRRLGQTMEFERIRRYGTGDDYRTMNWKATARRGQLMVNTYQDEKSQQVYSAIDMGRVMEIPFAGMSLLDYAINAALVISNIALRKQDRAGIITFAHRLEALLPADRRHTQLGRILDLLYSQTPSYLESDYEQLYAAVVRQVKQRSLILLYTNFETLAALRRQLPYLRRLASRHLLVTVFFQNTELHQVRSRPAATVEEIYIKTIAEQLDFEKRQIVKELERYKIQPILTTPAGLTAATINKYLELKARHLI
jgi:uncharacterized protein (DUF58 family)